MSYNAKHKKLRGAPLISKKTGVRRIVIKNGGILCNIKGSIHQEYVIEPQNTWRKKNTERRNKSTTVVGVFNIPLWVIDRTSNKKTSKSNKTGTTL